LSIGRGVSVGGGGGCTPVDQVLGSVTQGTTFTHPADGVVAWDVNRPSSGFNTMLLRAQDNLNGWSVYVNSGGDLRLAEQVNGANTTRAIASDAVPESGSVRVAVVLSSTTITGYMDGVPVWTYDSASQYVT